MDVTQHGEEAYATGEGVSVDRTDVELADRAHQREGWPAGKGSTPRPRSIAQSIIRVAEIIPQANGDAGGRDRHAPLPEGRQM